MAFQQNIQVDMANPADIAGLANNVAALAAVVNTLSASVHNFGRNVEQDRVATGEALRGMGDHVAEVRQAQRQAQEALAADVRGTNDNITRATNGLADAIAQAQARVQMHSSRSSPPPPIQGQQHTAMPSSQMRCVTSLRSLRSSKALGRKRLRARTHTLRHCVRS